jgi:hypothetical protein
MASIHIQELRARKSCCQACHLNVKGKCQGNQSSLKHNLLVGSCPLDLWPKDFKVTPYKLKASGSKLRAKKKPPSLGRQVESFSKSMKQWAKDRFRTVPDIEHERRLAICLACPSFDPDGWGGSGRCLECGCSTYAKSRIRSQSCPIGKW